MLRSVLALGCVAMIGSWVLCSEASAQAPSDHVPAPQTRNDPSSAAQPSSGPAPAAPASTPPTAPDATPQAGAAASAPPTAPDAPAAAPMPAAAVPPPASAQLGTSQPYVLVPMAQYQRQQRARRPRRSRGMMIAGIVLFAASYVPPAIIGGLVGNLDDEQCDCNDAFRMWIPVVGPLTLLHEDKDYEALNALLIMDTIAQGAGLALTIFGVMRYIASGRSEEEPFASTRRGLHLELKPSWRGAQAALTLRL